MTTVLNSKSPWSSIVGKDSTNGVVSVGFGGEWWGTERNTVEVSALTTPSLPDPCPHRHTIYSDHFLNKFSDNKRL